MMAGWSDEVELLFALPVKKNQSLKEIRFNEIVGFDLY
jgi:hypothetical protein